LREGLVLLNADPRADIDNTSKIEAVIFGGKLMRRADLDALLREGERVAAGTSRVSCESEPSHAV
jgi:hypothetical protein